MATVNLYNYFTVSIDNVTYKAGSLSTAQTLTAADGVIFDQTYSVANTTLTEIWSDDLMTGASTDFDFLWIQSDQDAELQFVCNEGGTLSSSNIENGFVVKVLANIPYVLSADDSRNMGNMAGAFSEGNHQIEIDTWESTWTADTIDRIEFYHSTSTTARVRVIAIT